MPDIRIKSWKKYLKFSVVFSFVLVYAVSFADPSFAHVPVIEEVSGEIILSDPTSQSIAAYGRINSLNEVDKYSFTAEKDEIIPIEVLVPVRVSNGNFHPSIIFAGKNLPEYVGDRVELVEGYGAIEILPPDLANRIVFFEPFSQEKLYHGNEQMVQVLAGEKYFVYLFEPNNQLGDYSLGLGTVENFENVNMFALLGQVISLKLGLVGQGVIPWLEVIGLFILMAGFIVGFGSGTVIDLHGFMARKSSYWTVATIRTHKITKPLIWIGIALVIVGLFLIYANIGWTGLGPLQAALIIALILNGLFLSFSVSPYLLKQERAKKDKQLLPRSMQRKIVFSFIVSVLGWWSLLASVVWYLIVLR